jgi:hypothetical protein
MSHFTVTVCVPKDRAGNKDDAALKYPIDSIESYVAEVLAPYDEDEEFFREGSRWDWYVIGGRWAGRFIARPGAVGLRGPERYNDSGRVLAENQCDVVRKVDIDWEAISARGRSAAADYWDKTHQTGERPEFLGFDPAMTREQYIAIRGLVATHGLVTKDGKWREPARMGWFGMTMEESKTRESWELEYLEYVSALDNEDVLVLVDCHV